MGSEMCIRDRPSLSLSDPYYVQQQQYLPSFFRRQSTKQEFCTAMDLIDAFKRGRPLPEFPTASTRKKLLKRSNTRPPSTSRTAGIPAETEMVPPRSPKRRSRLAPLIGNEQYRQATTGAETSQGIRDTRNGQEQAVLQREGHEREKSTVSIYNVIAERFKYVYFLCPVSLVGYGRFFIWVERC